MIARNVTSEQLTAAAEKVGVKIHDLRAVGRGWGFTLRPLHAAYDGVPLKDRKYTGKGFDRKKDGERRASYRVCWHGHRDFFRAVYDQAPDAIFRTALATYKSAFHFEHTYGATDRNVGSMVEPMYASEACWCEE